MKITNPTGASIDLNRRPSRHQRRRHGQVKAKHSFLFDQSVPGGGTTQIRVRATSPRPWTVKRRRRAANKAARASRKANR